MTYLRNNDKAKGMKYLLEAYNDDPNQVELNIKLGEMYLRDDNDIEKALKHLNKAIELEATISDAHFLVGKVYEKLGNDDMALKEYSIAV